MKKLWIGLILLVLVLAAAGMAGAEETITLNTPKTVEISIPGEVAVYQFTPTQTGMYRYYSSSVNNSEWEDTLGYLLDSGKQLVKQDDDSGENGHFSITRRLTAGKTYYFASFYYNESDTGSFRIQLDQIDGVYAEAKESVVYTPQGREGTAEVTAYSPNGGLTYQWYDGNTAISGATGSKYKFPALTAAKTFRCVVKDAANETREVTVEAKISSGLQVQSNHAHVEYGGSATLTVTATATYGADQLTYQWLERKEDEDGQTIEYEFEGETGNSITLTNVTSFRTIHCIVTDINGDSMECWSRIDIIGNTSVDIEPDGEREKTVEAGGSVTMTVQARNESDYPISYQWYKMKNYSYERIEGATRASYLLTNCYSSGQYLCQAVNSIGYSDTVYFYISVTDGFTATADGSEEITMTPGQTKTMKVRTMNSIGTVTYQWYRYEEVYYRDVPVRGANSASYQLSGNVRNGSWYCVATDGTGAQSSVWFSVEVESDFSAMEDSETSLTMNVGDEATLKVKATGTDLSYRWYESEYNNFFGGFAGDELIEDEEASSLTITCDGRRQYKCLVFDPYGHSADICFIVQVENGFSVSATQTEYSVEPGESVTLSVAGSCTNGTITYQWRHHGGQGSPISTVKESDESFLTIDAAGPDNYGRYDLYAYDEYGNSDSFRFNISIENHLSAEAVGDSNITIQAGEDVLLAVAASSDDNELSYQWYKQIVQQNDPNDYYYAPITNQTQATLQLTNIQQTLFYYCQVSDAYGGGVPVWFYIHIDNNLTVGAANGKTDFTVSPGEPVTMTVEASCTSGTLTYQWYEEQENSWYGDNPISGETSASYTIDSVNRAGRYVCVVRDQYGNEDNQWFWIYIDNNLTVGAANGKTDFTVSPGAPVTMTVEASCTSGTLTYQWYEEQDNSWYGDNPISGETSASYTLEAVNRAGRYVCVVRDQYGNEDNQRFWIYIDNNLTVGAANGKTDFTVSPGEPVTMTVEASCTSGTLTYRWYRDDEFLEDKTGSSLAIPSATRNDAGNYQCIVTDQYGNTQTVYFYVNVDNNLIIRNLTPDTVYPAPDGTATMTVEASCTVGDVTYAWSKGVRIYDQYGGWDWQYTTLPETGPSLTVTDASDGDSYLCNVKDAYGSNDNCSFSIYIPASGTFEINSVSYDAEEPGGEAMVSLSCWSSRGPLTYTWYRQDGNEEEYTLIEGVTGPMLIIQNVTGLIDIRCEIFDGTETWSCGFTVGVNIHLEIASRNPGTKLLGPNETETLTVTATSSDNQLTYQWTKNDVRIENMTGNSLQISGQDEPGCYECVVNGSYGNSRTYSFYRATATAGAALALNQTVNAEITEHCRIRVFSFTPTESGEYSFYSDSERDTYGYLFDNGYNMIDSDDDDGYRNNFLIARELTAGETVYLGVRYYSIAGDPGTIPVGVMKGEYRIEKDGGTLYLHEGQSAYLPEDYRNSESFDSAESGNGQVMAVSGRRITAGTAGQTTLHARYNEIQVNYTVIVEDTGVFALPEELEEIEDEAFAGVTMQYLEVGASVYNIYNGRFSGTGIHQALFRGDNTVISDGALGSEPFTIICYPNSQAYYYAQNHNCPWLSLE